MVLQFTLELAFLSWLVISITYIITCSVSKEWINFKPEFLWYDLWIGLYYERNKRILYINPIPCLVYSFKKVYKYD